MTEDVWLTLVDRLRRLDDGSVQAAAELQRQAGLEDVQRLVALLEDPQSFVREAAAWPLSDLGVTSVLPQLLRAALRGEREGLDNDGLNAALVDLVQAHPVAARAELAATIAGDVELRDIAVWLTQFC